MFVIAAMLAAAVFTRPMERVTTMDPAFAQAVYDASAVRLVYETPLEIDYDARPYRLSPGACDLPEVSPDGLTYVFRLRDAASPLRAADLVRSLERLRDPALVSPNGWMMKAVDTLRALDERTVEVRLKRRQHVFPWLMTMPPAAIRLADGSGTGPYRLESWWRNHEMVFRRRTPDPSGFDTVRYLVIDDVSTQWLMFLKGELDFLGDVSRDNWDAVLSAIDAGSSVTTATGDRVSRLNGIGADLHQIATLDAFYVGMNMNDPVLGPNRKLRQALNAAFDFPQWSAFHSGRVAEAGGPVPPEVDGALPAESFPYRFDLSRARRLMAEAGYPEGRDPQTGRRLVLTLAVGRASQDTRETSELLASFWEKIGVRLEVRFYTWGAFQKAVNEGRVQLYRMGWVGDYPDAENFLQLFHSSNVSPGPNHSAYRNPAFDRAYEAAMSAADAEERRAHWRTCQEIVREDCPWVFTHFGKSSTLVRPRVGHYVPSAFPYGQEARLRLGQTAADRGTEGRK